MHSSCLLSENVTPRDCRIKKEQRTEREAGNRACLFMGIVVPCKTIHDGGPRLWLRLSPGMGLPRLAINMAGGGMTVQSPRNTDLNAPLRLPTMDNICQGPLLGAVMALGNQGKNATHGGSALVYSYGRGCRTTEENGLCMTDSFSTQPIKLTSHGVMF